MKYLQISFFFHMAVSGRNEIIKCVCVQFCQEIAVKGGQKCSNSDLISHDNVLSFP